MRQHHNTLYITSERARLGKKDQAVEIKREGQETVRVPRHHLRSIVCFGATSFSPWLMAACAAEGIAVTFLSRSGRFQASVVGPQQGNVLLRRDHYRRADDPAAALLVARTMVIGKLANARHLLLRAARDGEDDARRSRLKTATKSLKDLLDQIPDCPDADRLRGLEGLAAKHYFDCFPLLLKNPFFLWQGRNTRPPRDPANAVLSFLYTLLATDCSAALQAVGLDPQVGFLHVSRPGRPALALDLMEEFRPLLGDRLLFALANREQLGERHFDFQPGGAVLLNDSGRKLLLNEYQKKKAEELRHPFLEEKTTYGLLPHVQARLLARVLRGDLDLYPPFLV